VKTRAAVAWKAGKPFTIEEVELAGAKLGEVLVERKSTGICHTDYDTSSGATSEGIFPAIRSLHGAQASDRGTIAMHLDERLNGE